VNRLASPGFRRLLALTLVVVLGLVVLAGPVLGYTAERDDVAAQREELARIQAENERLDARLSSIRDPAQIERIARDEYGLVAVGEESYVVLPRATAGVDLPRAWPFEVLAGSVATASASP
jgi:cell division protein FtsB